MGSGVGGSVWEMSKKKKKKGMKDVSQAQPSIQPRSCFWKKKNALEKERTIFALLFVCRHHTTLHYVPAWECGAGGSASASVGFSSAWV